MRRTKYQTWLLLEHFFPSQVVNDGVKREVVGNREEWGSMLADPRQKTGARHAKTRMM